MSINVSYKFWLLLATIIFSLPAEATIPSDIKCVDNFCISLSANRKSEILDFYGYGKKPGITQIFVRLTDGSSINFYVKRVYQKNFCNKSHLTTIESNNQRQIGSGCLSTDDGSTAMQVWYSITTISIKPATLISRHSPSIWLTGFNSKGDFVLDAGPIIYLPISK